MREIKFRAWDGRQMCDVTELSFFHGELITLHTKPKGSGEYARSITDTPLMQYTGLKDKNDKDIYEGDIVRISNYKENWKQGEPSFDWRIFKVIHNKYVYTLENSVIYMPFSHYSGKTLEEYDIEVVGNIYENAELLQSEE